MAKSWVFFFSMFLWYLARFKSDLDPWVIKLMGIELPRIWAQIYLNQMVGLGSSSGWL